MIVVGITGASGVIYGIRLLKALNELNIENSLIISDAAKTVINHEVKEPIEDIITLADNYYEFDDLTASINSGSFKFPRETPLRSIHLENMLNLSKEGAVILPAMPGFYSDSDTVDDQINFIVGKILDSLNIENNIYKRWE